MRHIAVGFCLLIASAGCGGGGDVPELGQVTGVVTVGGAAVPNATVTFSPKGEGRPSSGTTDSEGYYTLMYTVDEEGAVPGQHVVTVTADESDEDYQEADEVQDGNQQGSGLPEKATNGTLVVDVKVGSNEINVEL